MPETEDYDDLDEVFEQADRQRWSKDRLARELRSRSVPLNRLKRILGR